MKKILKIIMVSLCILTVSAPNILASSKSNELSTKQYTKTLKTYIKKDKFDTLDKYPTVLNPIKLHKAEKVGVDYGYIEPTLKKIKENKKKTQSLISFLEKNSTNNKEINILAKDMLSMLNDMNDNLDKAYNEFKNQYKKDISECDKLDNLQSKSTYFGFKNKLCAYDYINKYNDRVDKVMKIYNQIKKVS